MTLRNFFVGRSAVFAILLLILVVVAGFKALNSYIYNQKQAPAHERRMIREADMKHPSDAREFARKVRAQQQGE